VFGQDAAVAADGFIVAVEGIGDILQALPEMLPSWLRSARMRMEPAVACEMPVNAVPELR